MSYFLMRDILDTQLVEHGFFRPNLEYFSILTAIEELTQMLELQADNKNNKFRLVQLSNSIPFKIESDKSRFQ